MFSFCVISNILIIFCILLLQVCASLKHPLVPHVSSETCGHWINKTLNNQIEYILIFDKEEVSLSLWLIIILQNRTNYVFLVFRNFKDFYRK